LPSSTASWSHDDGGTDAGSNIVMACADCNNARQDTPVDVYKQMIMSRPPSFICS
jgi:5-methylcytosine-specific restriction endonuclease McrA